MVTLSTHAPTGRLVTGRPGRARLAAPTRPVAPSRPRRSHPAVPCPALPPALASLAASAAAPVPGLVAGVAANSTVFAVGMQVLLKGEGERRERDGD